MPDIVGDIRSLSSGTMSKLIRDNYFDSLRGYISSKYTTRRTLALNPLQAADTYIVDRVQYAFMMFVAGSDQRFENWIDAWKAYLKRLEDVRFEVGYMGATEYSIRGFSGRVECKSHASLYEGSVYNGDSAEFQRAVVGKVGCCALYYGATTGFPPNSICCLFPLYTPAMWKDGWVMSPDWPAPKTGVGVISGDIVAWHHDKRFEHTVDQYEEWRETAMSGRPSERSELLALSASA